MTLPESTTGKLEAIREKCIEANPGIVDYHPGDRLKTTPSVHPIRLADVCKAIQELGTSNLHDCPDGGRNVASVLLDLWDFDHDDLERQSEECVNYLSSLLVR